MNHDGGTRNLFDHFVFIFDRKSDRADHYRFTVLCGSRSFKKKQQRSVLVGFYSKLNETVQNTGLVRFSFLSVENGTASVALS